MYRRETKPDIVLVTGCTDFRCGINSLCSLLSSMGLDPFADAMYVFCRKGKDSLKILYWGGAGFWLSQYRLERGKFRWLMKNGTEKITYRQMEWLLDGLEVNPKGYIGEVKERLVI